MNRDRFYGIDVCWCRIIRRTLHRVHWRRLKTIYVLCTILRNHRLCLSGRRLTYTGVSNWRLFGSRCFTTTAIRCSLKQFITFPEIATSHVIRIEYRHKTFYDKTHRKRSHVYVYLRVCESKSDTYSRVRVVNFYKGNKRYW